MDDLICCLLRVSRTNNIDTLLKWLILKSKLNGQNKITAINTWAVVVFRYGAGILQLKESELQNLDKKIKGNNDNIWSITIRRARWTDCTIRGKKEVEAWWVWNVALEKEKMVWVFKFRIISEENRLCSWDNQYRRDCHKWRI